MILTILIIALLIGVLAYFKQLEPISEAIILAAGFVWQKLGKFGPRVLYGGFILLCLAAISSTLIVAGITNGNPLASGIGCLIAATLFLLTWSPIGFVWGLLGPKKFGSRMYPAAIRMTTFWLVCAGLLAMTIPSIFADQMATATLTQKLTAIVGTALFALLLALFSWSTNKSTTAFMKMAIAIVIALSVLAGIRFIDKDRFDSRIAIWNTDSKQTASDNFERADKGQTVYRTIISNTNSLYTVDSIVSGKTKTYKLTTENILVSGGQIVQVLKKAKPFICEDIALIQIKLPDSTTNKFIHGYTYWVEASLLSAGETEHVPSQYAVAAKSDLRYKIGAGGQETREITFDNDIITVKNLPPRKVVQYNGAETIQYYETGDSQYHNLKYGKTYQSPVSIKLRARKGVVLTITILS